MALQLQRLRQLVPSSGLEPAAMKIQVLVINHHSIWMTLDRHQKPWMITLDHFGSQVTVPNGWIKSDHRNSMKTMAARHDVCSPWICEINWSRVSGCTGGAGGRIVVPTLDVATSTCAEFWGEVTSKVEWSHAYISDIIINYYWLVVWLPCFIFPYIGNLIIPIDVPIFQRGGPTTNQIINYYQLWISHLSNIINTQGISMDVTLDPSQRLLHTSRIIGDISSQAPRLPLNEITSRHPVMKAIHRVNMSFFSAFLKNDEWNSGYPIIIW